MRDHTVAHDAVDAAQQSDHAAERLARELPQGHRPSGELGLAGGGKALAEAELQGDLGQALPVAPRHAPSGQ